MKHDFIVFQVQKFLDGICEPITSVLICVGTVGDDGTGNGNDRTYLENIRRLAEEHHRSVFVQQVTPWGKFTTALNIATGFAQANGFDYLQFMSLETTVSGTKTPIQTKNAH